MTSATLSLIRKFTVTALTSAMLLTLLVDLVMAEQRVAPAPAMVRAVNESLLGFPGLAFINGEVSMIPNSWIIQSPPITGGPGVPFVTKLTSKDGKMALEVTNIEDDLSEIVSWNGDASGGRPSATITQFGNGTATSYTFVKHGEAYTITRNLCEVLAIQFRSRSMDEFAEKATTCDSFYKVEAVSEIHRASVGNLESIHLANIQRLRNSVAKSAVPQTPNRQTASRVDWLRDSAASFLARGEKPKAVPKDAKDIFDAKTYPDGVSYRAALSEIGSACSRFFPNSKASTGIPTSKPAPSTSGGTAK